jgi:transposase
MLPLHAPRRKPSPRVPFREPTWDDDHPELRRIDLLLPADHPARWLNTVVARLDLAPLRCSYANRGSLAYLPQLLLSFVLFMYSKAILSPAQWATQVKYDDQAKWLLRGLQPSRSQLYTFRDRLEPYLDDWHAQIIAWALFEGLTSAERGSLDGTLIAALASRHRLLSCRRVDQRLLLLRLLVWCDANQRQCDLATFLDDLAAWLLHSVEGQPVPPGKALPPCADALHQLVALLEPLWQGQLSLPALVPTWVPASVAGRQRLLKRYVDAQQRLAHRLQPYQQKKKLSKKDQEAVKRLKVSLMDPEAALGWDKMGTYRPLYNLVLVQATDAPLTLAWEVLGCNNDQGLIEVMMEKTKKQVGRYLKELLVDGGFLNVRDVVWCDKEGIVLYAPPSKVEVAKAELAKAEAAKAAVAKVVAAKAAAAKAAAAKAAPPEAAPEAVQAAPPETVKAKEVKEGAKKEEKMPKSAFRYESTEQAYYCPQGKRLQPVSRTTEKRPSGLELPVIVYRAAGQDCQACPVQAGCTSNPKKGRVVKRYEGEEMLERLQQRMAEPASQQLYKLRGRTVELGHADLKEHRGLRIFRCFGKKGARVQAGLVILASNGLKIMNALQRRQTAQQHPSPQEKQPA